MVFDWKTVPADEKRFNEAHSLDMQEAAKHGVSLKTSKYEFQLSDWLKLELRWYFVGQQIVLAAIRKVHKKAKYPEEWFDYPKEREDELFAAKMKKILDDLSNRIFIAEAIETAMILMNNVNCYAGILSQIWAVLMKKEQNGVHLMIHEPTLRMATYIIVQSSRMAVPLENENADVDVATVSALPPLMPLTLLLSLPLIGRGFIPVVWTMQYSLYFGELLMLRVPQNYVSKTEEIAQKVIFVLLSGFKELVTRDMIRLYPVRAELLKSSVYPTAQVQLFISDRGLFFEKPLEFEWYVLLAFNMPRADTTLLLNMGARDYLSLASALFGNI